MRRLKGTIVSNKMQKTVVVEVPRLKKHRKYLKYYRISKRLKAGVDNEKDYHIGDVVLIEETRPLSRDKRWRVISLVRRIEPESEDSEESNNDSVR